MRGERARQAQRLHAAGGEEEGEEEICRPLDFETETLGQIPSAGEGKAPLVLLQIVPGRPEKLECRDREQDEGPKSAPSLRPLTIPQAVPDHAQHGAIVGQVLEHVEQQDAVVFAGWKRLGDVGAQEARGRRARIAIGEAGLGPLDGEAQRLAVDVAVVDPQATLVQEGGHRPGATAQLDQRLAGPHARRPEHVQHHRPPVDVPVVLVLQPGPGLELGGIEEVLEVPVRAVNQVDDLEAAGRGHGRDCRRFARQDKPRFGW